MIRKATVHDAHAILDIYSYYVLNSHSTFELSPPTIDVMKEKIARANHPWLVFEQGALMGYAYATSWKPREAYKYTVETSIYMHQIEVTKGYGTLLYKRLISDLQLRGYHIALAGISLPNDESIRLHEKLGFQKVAQLKQVGYKFERWIDVGYWELILDQ